MNKNIQIKDVNLKDYNGKVRVLKMLDKKGLKIKEIEPTGDEKIISVFEIEPLFSEQKELCIYVKA